MGRLSIDSRSRRGDRHGASWYRIDVLACSLGGERACVASSPHSLAIGTLDRSDNLAVSGACLGPRLAALDFSAGLGALRLAGRSGNPQLDFAPGCDSPPVGSQRRTGTHWIGTASVGRRLGLVDRLPRRVGGRGFLYHATRAQFNQRWKMGRQWSGGKLSGGSRRPRVSCGNRRGDSGRLHRPHHVAHQCDAGCAVSHIAAAKARAGTLSDCSREARRCAVAVRVLQGCEPDRHAVLPELCVRTPLSAVESRGHTARAQPVVRNLTKLLE